MPIIKRYNSLQNLQNIDVLFDETGLNSDFFNITEFPDPLQVGKNSFLIGGSEKLSNFIELKMDVVDFAGQSIYHEPVRGYLEGNMRRISLEVYDNNSPGSGFLYIVGEVNPDVVDIPEEWKGIYNVRYTRPITINTTQKNTQPIFFYKQPKIRGREVTKAFIEELYPSSSYSISGSVTTTASPTYVGKETTVDSLTDSGDNSPTVVMDGEDRVGKFLTAFKNKREFKKSFGKAPTVLALGRIQRRSSPEEPTHTIRIDNLESSPENDSDKVTSAFVGAHLEINNPVVDESTFYIGGNSHITTPTKYVTRIEQVINETTIVPETPFKVEVHSTSQSSTKQGYKDPNFNKDGLWANESKLSTFLPSNVIPKQPDSLYTDETGTVWVWEQKTSNDLGGFPNEESAGGDVGITYYGWNQSSTISQESKDDVTSAHYVSMLPNSNVTMSVVPTPENTLTATHLRSYLDMSVIDMRTFSGDIFRTKVYGKLRGGISDFELLYDSPIESPQVLYDPFSVDGYTNVGYFYSDTNISNYWASSSNSTVEQNNQYMVDGALISGSNYGVGEKCEFYTTSSYSLERNIQYALSFNAYFIKQDKEFSSDDGTTTVKKAAELKVYLSGSRSKDGTGGGDDIFLGSVKIPKNRHREEGEKRGVFQTFLSSRRHFPTAQPKFVAESGQWVITDVDLKPTIETNFSPDYFRAIVPLPVISKRPTEMDFLVEFYDVNNNIADSFAFMERFRIIGAPEVIQGDKNLLSGSLYLGNVQGQGIELHGGSAYMRSIGYEGFQATTSSGSGGFMIWSGSLGNHADGTNLLQSTESYDGVGLEIVDAHGATDRYLKFRTNPSTFQVVTDEFFLGSSTQFVSGSNANIEISSSKFHLQPDGDVVMNDITASSALITGSSNIGGWILQTDPDTGNVVLSGSGASLDGTGAALYKTGQGPVTNKTDGFYIDFTPTDQLGSDKYYVRFGSNFAVRDDGILFASGAKIEGVLTASEGYIAEWTIAPSTIHKLTSTKYSGLSSAGDTRFFAGADDLTSGTGSAVFNVKADGVVTASAGKIGGWKLNPAPEELRSPNERLVLSARASQERITVKNSSGTDVLKIGEISSDTSDKYGIKIYDGSGATDDNLGTGTVVMLGGLGNKIGGWEITDTQIRSIPDGGLGSQYDFDNGEDGLILSNVGRIHSAAYVPNQRGWNIDTVTNGFAEFQNIVVRGTLKTAVFQKDSVNVVGGTLRVANAAKLQALRSGSTVLSGSVSMSANSTTMSVDNVSGFEDGEILLAKKIGNTGFQTEYLYVTGSKRWSTADPSITGSGASNDPDGISGELYVGRAYGQLTGGDVSGSSAITLTNGAFSSTTIVSNYSQSIFNVDDASGISKQDYLKVEHPSSGNFEFVKVTAISSNTLTVRRKAWFPLDINLGATEITSGTGWPNNSKVWLINDRLFSAQLNNVVSVGQSYEEGQVFASTGKFTEWISSGWIDLDANPTSPYTPMIQIMERTGSGVYDYVLRTQLGDLSGLSSAYLYGDENPGFGLYTENGFFKGAINAMTGSIHGILHVATSQGGIETGQKISIGRNVSGTDDGIYINNNNYWFTSAEFRLGDGSNYLWVSGSQASPASSFKIKTDDLSIDTDNFILSSSLNNGTVKLGSSAASVTSTTNTGIYMDGTGKFRVGESVSTGDNYIYFNGSSVQIKSSDLDINASGVLRISGSSTGAAIRMGSSGGPTGATDTSNSGVFMDHTGKWAFVSSSKGYIRYDSALEIKTPTLELDTANIEISSNQASMSLGSSNQVVLNGSSGGSVSLGSGTPSLSTDGIFLSGTGEFNLQKSSNEYIRYDGGGFAINFPSFSVSPSGIMSATDGTFAGHLKATSGFIGSSETQGWNIDGNTFTDTNGIIILDATAASPNITISSGSYFAEMVPDFTPGSTILSGGGQSFNATSIVSGSSNNGTSTGTISLSTGQVSNAIDLHGGFVSGSSDTPSIHTTLDSIDDASLTTSKPYRSTCTVKVGIAVETPNYGATVTYGLDGYTTVSGNLILRRSSDNSDVGTVSISGGHLIDIAENPSTELTSFYTTFSATVNHTTPTTDDTTDDHYWHVDNITVTNNGITETYSSIVAKTFTSTSDIKSVDISFTSMNHSPSNKKVEVAPGGIQAVSLISSTLEDSQNKYFRVSPAETKTVDILGSTHLTGSLHIKEGNSDTDSVEIDPGSIYDHVSSKYYRIKSGGRMFVGTSNSEYITYDSTNDGIAFWVENGEEFLMGDTSNAGNFHALNNITAFSTLITSDIRLKENIKPLENNLDKILKLKPSSFRWKVRDQQDDVGLIAQEVESIIPEIVSDNVSIGKTKEFLDKDTHKTVDYAKLTTYLIGAIKEQQTQIDELKQKLEEL